MKFGISEKSYDLIIKTLNSYPEIEKAVIFGSRALGNHKQGSDIDIALFGNDLRIDILDEIKAELNERQPIPYFVDIIDYDGITNPELKKHIDEFRKILFEQ